MTDGRHEALSEQLLALARGDYDARTTPSDSGDELDAIIIGVNMLAEELGIREQRIERAQTIADDAVDHYEHAPAMFASVDVATWNVIKCNQTLADVVGRAKDDIVGRSFLKLYARDDWPDAEAAFRSFMAEGELSDAQLTLLGPSGEPIHVLLSISAVRDDKGDVIRGRLVWRDIRRLKELEVQLLESQKLEAVGRLAGGVAHDFNNLLTVVVATASMLREELGEDDETAIDLDQILNAAHRAAALTEQLLAISRRNSIRTEPIDANETVRTVVSMLSRTIGADVDLAAELDEGLWYTEADAAHLEQVLLNLGVNARDAMPSGGRLVLTTTNHVSDGKSSIPAGEYIRIDAADDGVGMSEDVRRHVFDAFFTTKKRGEGTGLGLAVSQNVIQRFGGVIEVDSTPGRGTTFSIYLPRTMASPDPKAPDAALEPAQRTATIVVVDDEPSVRSVAARSLRSKGHTVLTAASGEEALRIAKSFDGPIHLLLTDVVMPVMGGVELVDEFLEARSTTKVLFMSGYPRDARWVRGIGDVALLPKPFTSAQLEHAVQHALASK